MVEDLQIYIDREAHPRIERPDESGGRRVKSERRRMGKVTEGAGVTIEQQGGINVD